MPVQPPGKAHPSCTHKPQPPCSSLLLPIFFPISIGPRATTAKAAPGFQAARNRHNNKKKHGSHSYPPRGRPRDVSRVRWGGAERAFFQGGSGPETSTCMKARHSHQTSFPRNLAFFPHPRRSRGTQSRPGVLPCRVARRRLERRLLRVGRGDRHGRALRVPSRGQQIDGHHHQLSIQEQGHLSP